MWEIDEDHDCPACGLRVSGHLRQVCPPRQFRFSYGWGAWVEQPPEGEWYFVCVRCGTRLDEETQAYLFEHILPRCR